MKNYYLIITFIILFCSANSFAQNWVQQINPITGEDLNGAWAVNTNVCWMCGGTNSQMQGYVILTTNAGVNWTNATGNMASLFIGLYSICGISASEAWIGASDGSVFHTTNAGTTWTLIPMPNPVTTFINVIHFFNQNSGFIIGDPASSNWCYYRTTNAGVNWNAYGIPEVGSMAGWNNSYCAIDTGHIWFGTNAALIYKGGFRSGFVSVPTIGQNSFGVAFVNAYTGLANMANSSYTVIPNNITINGGTNWTSGYTPAGVQYAAKNIPGSSVVWSCGAGNTGGTILYSSDNGVNWSTYFAMNDIGYCITFASPGHGWVGCTSGTIYGYSAPDEIKNNITSSTTNYILEQNYPNPFNPITVISYSLLVNTHVLLKVFDVIGQEIATLVDEFQNAGNHKVLFSNNRLSGGIYFYKTFAGDFIDVKKMILLK